MRTQARDHVDGKVNESDGAPPKSTGTVSGEFVTESFEYDKGRQVTVYVPSDPPEAIVFAGDGQGISKWGQLLEDADVPSTMIIGVHGLADETLRLHEYSPGFEPERFAAHEMDEVAVWRGAARRTYRSVRRLGGRRAGPRPWASASTRLRCGLLRLAWRGLPASW
jgi:hypothetical protein